MRRISRFMLVAVAVLAPAPVMAGKIGWVEVEKAAVTVQEGKAAIKQLDDWAAPRKTKLDSLRDVAATAQQKFLKERGVASDDAVEELQKTAVAAKRRFEDAVREFQRQYDDEQNKLLADVAHKMNKVVSDYAEANGYDAVFIFQQRTLIYLRPAANITDEIIKLYDQRFPVKQQLRSGKQLGSGK
jgi:Skp family chaperone for outer membrane proteins